MKDYLYMYILLIMDKSVVCYCRLTLLIILIAALCAQFIVCNIELLADNVDSVCVFVSLSEVSRTWLRAFGSALISKLQFRDNFVMIGQRGLAVPGSAVEQVDTVSS